MKKIGIVGGLAWPSTITYYRIINEEIGRRLGGNHSASLVLAQPDFEEIERNQSEGNWNHIANLIANEVNCLKAAGADFFILACNTVHTVCPQIEAQTDLPYIHIVDSTAEEIIRRGFHTVGLMGTEYTLEGTFFKGKLKDNYGLNVLIPHGEHLKSTNDALYDELVKGIIRDETRLKFKNALADLVDRGAEAIILGCTEIGLILRQEDSPVPLIDTSVIHALAAADYALSE